MSARLDGHDGFRFRLYVSGDTPNSAQAIGNLHAICREHLPGRHEIEVVDVFREPQKALDEGIFMTPTLVKLAPLPSLRIVGTLTDTGTVLRALNPTDLAP